MYKKSDAQRNLDDFNQPLRLEPKVPESITMFFG